MRIERLELTRFGCFTDCSLDLSARGLHVVVGSNEAGKTTTMAAIRQLLFGILHRSPHAFVHKMKDLAIGATVSDEKGEALQIVRLKRRTDALRNPAGEILDETLLARMLHDVSEEVYASLFTIGHDEIAQGGEALLSSDGDVGRALFSASRGTADLAAVMARLDDAASALFKSSGKNPQLNVAISEYAKASRSARKLAVSATEVIDLDQQLANAQGEIDRIASERKEFARRAALLQQVRSSRPQLIARSEALIARDLLADAGPLVEPTVGEQLKPARDRRDQGQSDLHTAEAAIERLADKLARLAIDQPLLNQRETIEQLRTDAGGYEQNRKDLPGLAARASKLDQELARLRRQLPEQAPLDAQGQPNLTVDQRELIEQLADESAGIGGRLGHAKQEERETATELAGLRRQLQDLEQPLDVTALVEISSRIRKAGDLEDTRGDSARRLALLDSQLAGELTALGLADSDPRSVDTLAVPSLDTIRRMGEAADALAAEAKQLQGRIVELQTSQTQAKDSLAELLRSDEPPTQTDLRAARDHRQAGWRLIRADWLDDTDPGEEGDRWADGKPLPDAYQSAVKDADEIADRLRRQASAVEQRSALEDTLGSLARELEQTAATLDERRREQEQAEVRWRDLWAPLGITPEAPRAMEDWRGRYRECAQQSAKARELHAELTALDRTIARHQGDLAAALERCAAAPADDLSLLGLLDLAEHVSRAALAARQEHDALTESCREKESLLQRRSADSQQAEATRDAWQARWQEAVTAIGLSGSATPGQAKAVLECLGKLSNLDEQLQTLLSRIAGIEARNAEFLGGVEGLLATLDGHDDLGELDPGTAVKMLARRLSDAQGVDTEARTHREELEDRETDRSAAELLVSEAERLIAKLVESAGVADEAALERAIQRSHDHAGRVAEIVRIEDELRGTGKPLAQIEAEAAAEADIEIEPEIEELEQKVSALDEQLKSRASAAGELRHQRSLIDTSGAAADQLTLAQQSLATLAEHADTYVQTLLARRLLEEQVEAYRDEHQGPLLARARELFRALTLERYLGLDTDTNTKGQPVLLAVRADETRLEIDELSSGTRDQLYLALRLAALEQFIGRRGPLPLILDDLFVHFDDERTRAGLAVLDRLADTTQVVLFSHHRQVASLARQVIDADRLTVHELVGEN